MTEEEIEIATARHDRRTSAFMKAGLSREEAWELADRMFDRDADPQDDRRLCFECRNLQDNKCVSQYQPKWLRNPPPRFILQRCDYFDLRGKK